MPRKAYGKDMHHIDVYMPEHEYTPVVEEAKEQATAISSLLRKSVRVYLILCKVAKGGGKVTLTDSEGKETELFLY